MDKSRFSLLLLEPGEIYFEDFSSTFDDDSESGKITGRLKLCSKSILFEPQDSRKPIYKILLQHCDDIKEKNNLLVVECRQHAQILTDNVIAPYVFSHKRKIFVFNFYYVPVEDCLQQILQLRRASSLPPPEQNSMIAAICYSKQCRLSFDPSWLEDIYETVVVEVEASKVSPLVVNPGRIVLSATRLYFQPFNNAESYPVLKINLSLVKMVIRRRFLQRQVGLELFCDGASVEHLYLTFKTESDREKLCNALLDQPALDLPSLQPEIMTLKWQHRAISNFEYLQYLNSLADRSVNDLTQYPVFPWVIADYSSTKLDLDDPKVFRDLTKPVGALNPDRLHRLKRRRDEMGGHRFLYGSHYSAPAFVLFYLIRKYPQYMLCLQNGRFDHPDRIFYKVSDVWRNVLENMADFKELIPEFYDTACGGDFLVNSLGVHLGARHDGHTVHDVILPPWCEDARDFVRKLRDALESEHVSQTLPGWIDLVFGWKQRGEPAQAADNVFYHLCYEGAVDLDAVKDLNERHALEVQIMEFGQIPKQIFHVRHPPRLKASPISSPSLASDLYPLSSLRSTLIGNHREAVTAVACWEDVAISVGRDSVLKEFDCKSQQEIRSVHLDTAGISSCLLLPGGDIVILGTFDNRILVYELECSKVVDEVRAHEDAVSALCWSAEAGLLVSGSWDGTLRVWPRAEAGSSRGRLKATPTTRFDREARVTCAALDTKGEMTACGTEDGEIAVFHIASSAAVLQLQPHNFSITAVTFDGHRLISASDKGFQIHDLTSGMHVYSACSDLCVVSMAWLEEMLLVGTADGSIQCWDLQQVKLIENYKSADSPITSLTASSSSKYVVLGEGKKIVLLNT